MNPNMLPPLKSLKRQDLLDAFSAKTVLTKIAFHRLIDLAEVGRRAAGLSGREVPTGLHIEASGRLGVKCAPDGWLIIDPDSGRLKLHRGNGIAGSGPLCVQLKKPGGLATDKDGLRAKLDPDGALAYDDDHAVTVSEGAGIEVSSGGVAVSCGGGLQKDPGGLALRIGQDRGLTMSRHGLEVRIQENDLLKIDDQGVMTIDGEKVKKMMALPP